MLRRQIAARDACVDPGNAGGVSGPAQQRLPTRLVLVEVTIIRTIRCRSRQQPHAHGKQHRPGLETWAKDQHAAGQAVPWYKDTFTGTTMDRPGLERLLADVRQGKVNKVVCWRLDRLGRTAKGLLTLLDELQALGVGFVSLREGFDLNTPAGRLMAGVLASVAAYETEVRKERQLAGIAKAKAEGKTWGGRRPGTRIKLTEEKEALIGQLHAEGKPVAAIARMVGLTRKTVYKAIRGQEAAV